MWLESATEGLGENGVLAVGALLIGVVFGFMAQRSRFCLRSAVIEFSRGTQEGKLTGGSTGRKRRSGPSRP